MATSLSMALTARTTAVVIATIATPSPVSAWLQDPLSATVTGRVLGGSSARPLVGARVLLASHDDAGLSFGTISDSSGAYRLSVPEGNYRLSATAPGYRTASLEVRVRAGATMTVSPTLEAEDLSRTTARTRDTTVIFGRVLDARSDRPIAGAIVSIEGTDLAAQTDSEGRYRILNTPAGPYVIRARSIGFAPSRIALIIPREGAVHRDLRLAANPLLLEGVTVVADPVSRARGEVGTATVIEHEAIREQTAASLAGVLELVPGTEIQPPGLDDLQQFALRTAPTSGTNTAFTGGTSSTDLGAFGTLILLDGVPVSNNANLQTLGPRNEVAFTTSAEGGIDLRQIPAATLERVEVIRGVPSARYGDLTQGAIVVDTRAGEVTPELLARYDSRTNEASLSGGWGFRLDDAISGTLDLARTRTMPGITDARANRVAGQLAHRWESGDRATRARLILDSRVDGLFFLDHRPPSPNVLNRSQRTENRGIRVTERARWRLTSTTSLNATVGYSAVQQSSAIAFPRTIGATPITSRLQEGRSIGQYVLGAYVTDVSIEGRPRLAYVRLEGDGQASWGGQHQFRAGIEARREWNGGSGIQFDVLRPHQVLFNGVTGFDRPRSFETIRPLVTSAMYVDDRFAAELSRHVAVTIQAGLRLDLLHRGGTWFTKPGDALFQPRFNAELTPHPWLRIRAGWGRSAKAPSLAQLSPQPQYFDVVNVNWFANNPAERLAVLTTFVRDPVNPDLRMSRATKAEVGIEVGPGPWAVSLVAFNDRIDGGIGIRQIPSYVLRDHYELTDSTAGTGVPPNIIEPPTFADTMPVLIDKPDNILSQRTRGLELIGTLPEIPGVRLRLQLSGAWIETERRSDALDFAPFFRFPDFQVRPTIPRTPYWTGAMERGTRGILTYRLIHHQPELGLVLTAVVQHYLKDLVKDSAGTDTLAFAGYVTRSAELVEVPESDRGGDQYRDLRVPRGGTLIDPIAAGQDWLLSVQVSKTFPLGGRLSFWAFNLLDRRGTFSEAGVQPRLFRAMRLGVELSMPVPELLGWVW
jgi:outer membrane receptor protein involved in Fe transport